MRTILPLLVLSLPLLGQEQSTTRAQKPTSTVHFYRYKQFAGSALKPSIYIDGTQVARMQNGRFLDVSVPAGKHEIYSNDKQSGAEIEMEPGKEYWVRLELVPGMWKGHARIMVVPQEQGNYDVKRLERLDTEQFSKTANVIGITLLAAR